MAAPQQLVPTYPYLSEPGFLTDANGIPFSATNPLPVTSEGSTSVSGILQNAATSTGNGSTLGVTGMSTGLFLVNMTGFTGTVTFQGSADGTNFTSLLAVQLGTSTLATSTTGSTTTGVQLWETSIAGMTQLQAAITRSAGSVTVTAYAVPLSFAARTLNLAALAGVLLPAFGVLPVAAATKNAALAAGTGTTPVVIKASAGYLKSFVVTTTASAALSFYDNASAASGTVLYTTASNIAAGTVVVLDMPFANGLTVSQATGSMAATIAYS
jgi:hypothetical protein